MPDDRDSRPRHAWTNALVAALLGIAVLVAAGAGLRAIYLAQTGDLQPSRPDPDTVYARELPRDQRVLHECRDATGRSVWTSEPCGAGTDGRDVEVVTLELQPPPVATPGGPAPGDAGVPPAASRPQAPNASP